MNYRIKEMGMNMERRAKVQKIKRLLRVGVTAVMLALLGVSPAFAASAISSVNITLDLDIEAGEPLPSLNCGYTGDDCEVAVSSNSRYDISSISRTMPSGLMPEARASSARQNGTGWIMRLMRFTFTGAARLLKN